MNVSAVRSPDRRLEVAEHGGAVAAEFAAETELLGDGTCEFRSVPVGVWRLTVERAGWAPVVVPDVRV